MGSNRDHSPVGYTCPMIDDVKSLIEILEGCISDQNLEDNFQSSVYEDIKQSYNELEKIRSHNDELRCWGNDLYEEKERIENDYEYLERQSRQKDEEIEYWKNKFEELEREVENV